MNTERTPYPSDVTEAEWNLAAPYLTLMTEDAPQREYGLREVLNALRWLVETGGQWRMMPHDFPPWPAVDQQARRWVAVGCFEAMTHDLREAVRVAAGRAASPTAAILDGRTLQSTPESGSRRRSTSSPSRRPASSTSSASPAWRKSGPTATCCRRRNSPPSASWPWRGGSTEFARRRGGRREVGV